MIYEYNKKLLFLVIVHIAFLYMMASGQEGQDLVSGNLIQFNDNGAWCWYQDERAVIDTIAGKLILGSDASGSGVGGSARNGHIEGTIFDLQTRTSERTLFRNSGCDDHNAPAFLVLPDGQYLTMYCDHYDGYSRYRVYDGNDWSGEQTFDWSTIPGGTDFSTTYSNLFYLSSVDKLYNISRCDRRSPNIIESDDDGNTWSYVGYLTEPDLSIGYVNGYFKYCGNGVDRIDFFCTEHHPRDYNTSLYHGYIKDNQTFDSFDNLLDSTIYGKNAPKPADFTLIFKADTSINGMTLTRCWNNDIQTYPDSTIAVLFKARVNDTYPPSNNPDHVFFYGRFDGEEWISTYLGKAGKKMYYSEQDYTGLGALHPNNPNIIYISVPFDPRDDSDLGVREIFKGVTDDNGTTWNWTQITQNSECDNFRPIIPAWDKNHTVLLWWRGIYNTAQNFDAAVVGIIESNDYTIMKQEYRDANETNTTFLDGSALVTTGPDENRGPADDQWHQRTGFGNKGNVLTSAEIDGEDAPALKTQVMVSDTGKFDVWVNFWANPSYDWRIKAGLSVNSMQIFRQMACKQVEDGDHYYSLILTGSGNTYLYQAYLGRVHVTENHSFDVYVDDEAIEVGTTNTQIGDVARTWYDGISFASLDTNYIVGIDNEVNDLSIAFNLSQNYPNPFNSTTSIEYAIDSRQFVSLKVYNLLGKEIVTLVNEEKPAGVYMVEFDARELSSGIYIYQLQAGDFTETRKMMLMR